MGYFDNILAQVFGDNSQAPVANNNNTWFSQFMNLAAPSQNYTLPQFPQMPNAFGMTVNNMSRGLPMEPIKLTGERYHMYDNIINEAATTFNLDPKLLRAVIKQESDFNNQDLSHAGAAGLMQLMPGTAKELGVTDVYDPRQNIMGGAKYLAQQLKRFNGDVSLALAAYNAGPGRVIKAGNQIPNIAETKHYVDVILNKWYGRV